MFIKILDTKYSRYGNGIRTQGSYRKTEIAGKVLEFMVGGAHPTFSDCTRGSVQLLH